MWLVIYVLLYFPLTRLINMFIIYMVLVPLIGFIVNYGIRIPVKRFFKYCAIVSISTCLVALPVIILFSFKNTMPITEKYTKSSVELELGNRIIDSIRFIRTFAWKCSSNEEIGGILSYSFLPNYQKNPFLVFITFYPILMIFFLFIYFYPKLQKSEKSKVLGLLLIIILTLIFTTPSLTPIGKLLYQNKIYILRSAWKYFSIPYILCLSMILSLLLKQFIFELQKRKYIIILILLLVIHSTYILPAICIYGKQINRAWIVKIPEEYYDLAEFLKKDHEEYRILPLPITKHFAGYVPYKWGYVGPDILYTLTKKPIIDKHHNVIATQEYLNLMNEIETATPEEILYLCKILNVKYILLRGDVNTDHPYIKLNHSPEYYKYFLDNSVNVKHKFINLTLYELNNYTQRIFLQPIITSQNTNKFLNTFIENTYKKENVAYLWLNENPITIKKYKNSIKKINNFKLNITFQPLHKNITDQSWQKINQVPIQTELFKIIISPKGFIYVFLYSKNGTYYSLVAPFQRMGKISLLEITFQKNILSVYLNKVKIHTGSISDTELVDKFSIIKIGSNFGNTEKFVGRIYSLNFNLNNEEEISTQKLFLNYTDYIKKEETLRLNLNPLKTDSTKISPTKYIIKINNTKPKQNGYFITLLTTYDPEWKAYITQKGSTNQIAEDHHIKTFNYANTWYINQTGQIEITLKYEPQKWFYYGLAISITSLFGSFVFIILDWKRKHYSRARRKFFFLKLNSWIRYENQ